MASKQYFERERTQAEETYSNASGRPFRRQTGPPNWRRPNSFRNTIKYYLGMEQEDDGTGGQIFYCNCSGGQVVQVSDMSECASACGTTGSVADTDPNVQAMRSASGKTQAQIKNEQTTKNLVGFVALTAASAYIGSKIAKNKTRGAVIGGVGYAVAVFLYMKSKTRNA